MVAGMHVTLHRRSKRICPLPCDARIDGVLEDRMPLPLGMCVPHDRLTRLPKVRIITLAPGAKRDDHREDCIRQPLGDGAEAGQRVPFPRGSTVSGRQLIRMATKCPRARVSLISLISSSHSALVW
jgi:hypothetical protein